MTQIHIYDTYTYSTILIVAGKIIQRKKMLGDELRSRIAALKPTEGIIYGSGSTYIGQTGGDPSSSYGDTSIAVYRYEHLAIDLDDHYELHPEITCVHGGTCRTADYIVPTFIAFDG